MELFYSQDIDNQIIVFSQEESRHMIKVLRHSLNDSIDVTDGRGNLYRCIIVEASPNKARAKILSICTDWEKRDYHLTMLVAPTKNNDRFEHFVEKACEIGVDCIIPLIAEHSQRKVYKVERAERIALSAMKQSLKTKMPVVEQACAFEELILRYKDSKSLKLIAHCMENEKKSIMETLIKGMDCVVLIGPEGDFSPKELSLALEAGFLPVHLGNSRLRTETAAIMAVSSVYLFNM